MTLYTQTYELLNTIQAHLIWWYNMLGTKRVIWQHKRKILGEYIKKIYTPTIIHLHHTKPTDQI